jgi:Ca2+-binding RTX toxin-like protein
MDGGPNIDTAFYAESLVRITANLRTEVVRGLGTDSLSRTENLVGSDLADVIIGSYYGEVLDGGPGDDAVAGGGGNDSVEGGEGRDRLDGGPGEDVVEYYYAPVR